MSCNPEALKHVPLFALLDDEETAVLAGQVELKKFAPRQRIYKMGDAAGQAYVMVYGRVRVTTLDQEHQEAGMDVLTVLGKQFHASQQLVRVRASRNPNEMIEKEATFGERIADSVAGFGGSWTFILTFLAVLVIYTIVNISLGKSAWDPYPFILLNLFLSMLAAIQAPVIMMSQNRQDTKDRLRSELDFDVNRRAESEIQGLAHKLNLLGDKIGDVEDLLRQKLS